MCDSSVSAGFVSGQIDMVLLKVISVGDCYGYNMYKILSQITSHAFEIKEATLYAGLRRLETEKLIASYWGDETQGGRRKYYTITEQGRAVLADNINKWNKTKFIIDAIIHWEGAYHE